MSVIGEILGNLSVIVVLFGIFIFTEVPPTKSKNFRAWKKAVVKELLGE